MIKRYPLKVVLTALALCWCAAVIPPGQVTLAATNAVSAFDTLKAAAIVESEDSRILLASDGTAKYFYHAQIRILREGGLERCAIDLYENDFVKVADFAGRVRSTDGAVILERKRKDLVRTCGFGASFSLYDDICFLATTLSAGNYPFTIDYTYELELSSLFFWHDWLPQKSVPVARSVYTVIVPAATEFRYRPVGALPEPTVTVDPDGKWRTCTWSLDSVAAFKAEPLAPPAFESQLRVEFAPRQTRLKRFVIDGESWASLAASYDAIAASAFALDSESKAAAARWSAVASDLNTLHEHLMSRQRYVSINIGIGGWQPHAAGATYKNRYGDCKDLSTLYAALLNELGVSAHLVLLRTRDEGHIDPGFPTLSNFNHAILLYTIGADTTWVDPTCNVCALGDLPEADEGTYGLIIDPDSGRLVRLPESEAADNLVLRRIRMMLNPDLSALLAIDLEAVGNLSHTLKYAAHNLTAEEFGEYLRRQKLIPAPLKDLECTFDRYDSTLSRFVCRVSGNLRRAGIVLDNRVHLDPDAVPSIIGAERPDTTKRAQPLDFGYAATSLDSFNIAFPEDWQAIQLPPIDSVASRFGTLSLSASQAGDRIALVRRHSLAAPLIRPEDFGEFLGHQKACADFTARNIVFERAR